ncbi:maintenance of mitochondrial structure and function-domain-containing protein [Gaertneriomyces semiglobifer]|nr:maintenance of mitochondrial structure and function-domain-containing protein [Gaertneriomyces semiglobifer]
MTTDWDTNDGAAAATVAVKPATASFSVSVGPVVLFSVLDHFLRRPAQQTRVIGALLGIRSEDGSEVEIRNSFPLSYTEAADHHVVVDTDYLNQMYSLHQRVNSKETIVGWYATGTNINPNSVWIHEFFANETTPFQPVHLIVDTTLSNDRMACRSFVSSQVGVPGTEHPGSMFLQIPCEVKYFDAERSGLDLISTAKDTPDKTVTILSDMESLERSILHVQRMVETVSNYVDSVLSKKEKANSAIGRFLMDVVSLVPRIDATEFEKMFNKHLNDLLMVVYLANLTRSQLAIAERLHKMM